MNSEVGSRNSELGSRNSELGSRKLEVGTKKSEIRSPYSAFVVIVLEQSPRKRRIFILHRCEDVIVDVAWSVCISIKHFI